ncbi:MAG: YfhO family protein [Verrucomicrobia bacterium]|nr:YfhO family protein [Verrucomicrobiota bacterium]
MRDSGFYQARQKGFLRAGYSRMREKQGNPGRYKSTPGLFNDGFWWAMALLLLVQWGPVLLGWRSLFTRDFLGFGYPLAWHLRESLGTGEFPLWNAHLMAGTPHGAQWNTMVWYPPMLLLVWLPMPWGLNVFNLVHWVWGAWGMRRWVAGDTGDGNSPHWSAGVAGVSYGCGGLMLTAMMWPNNAAALGWAPWLIRAVQRAVAEGGRSSAWAAACVAMQLLCGAPEITGFTWLLALCVGCFQAREKGVSVWLGLGRLSTVFALAIGMGAVQWVPFLELLSQSHRDAAYAGNEWSMSWAGMAAMVLPWFQTVLDRDGVRYQVSQQWLTSPYAGVAVLTFSILALIWIRRSAVRVAAVCAGLLAALSMGSDGLLLDRLRQVLPWLGAMRYPVKFVVPLLLVMPWLAGLALREWFRDEEDSRKRREFAWVMLGAALSILLLGASEWIRAESAWPAEFAVHLVTRLAVLAALAGILWRWKTRGALSYPWVMPALVFALVGWDLLEANRHIGPTVPAALMQPAGDGASRSVNAAVLDPKPVIGAGRAHVTAAGRRRLDAELFVSPEAAVQIPRLALVLNMSLLEGIPKLDGFLSLYLPRTLQWLGLLDKLPEAARLRWLSFVGVTHLARDAKPWIWDRIEGDGQWMRWIPEARQVSEVTASEIVTSTDFDPYQVILVEGGEDSGADSASIMSPAANSREEARQSTPRVQVKVATHHRWLVEVEAERAGYLFFAMAHERGWQAKADGMPIPILRANVAFQAVRLEAGRHRIEWRYRPRTQAWGVSISSVAGLAWLWLFKRGTLFPASRGTGHQKVEASG